MWSHGRISETASSTRCSSGSTGSRPQLERLNRTTEQQEGFALVARELRELNESLNALAYAALGQSPRVRRRAG